MKIEQRRWEEGEWSLFSKEQLSEVPQLVLAFGDRATLQKSDMYAEIKELYPDSHIVSGSSAGEILGTNVTDGQISLTAIHFEKTSIEVAEVEISDMKQSEAAGESLGKKLTSEGLVHVMMFSDGLQVNGTGLVAGISKALPDHVSVTGGLVGDGADFKQTALGLDAVATSGRIVAIGFYGEALKVSYASFGGWDDFGPKRKITKATDNVLLELDGEPALAIYKEYLGDKADELPGSGLLFPLSLDIDGTEVVRTLLAVDEEAQSMTFAGTMPEGVSARLMKANFDRLIDGAGNAAGMSAELIQKDTAELAVLISCIGRKLVLGERVEEEVEAVRGVLGEGATITGFYSYGEICPTAPTEKQCRLHNQTMTITTMREE